MRRQEGRGEIHLPNLLPASRITDPPLMKAHPKASSPVSPDMLAANFERQLIETARRCIAMRRALSGAVCRWRRAARTGPNSDMALVFIWRKGMPPQTEVWPYARIEQLAAAVTEEEVRAEIGRSSGTGEAGSPE